jgi:hypothetical protein
MTALRFTAMTDNENRLEVLFQKESAEHVRLEVEYHFGQ